jgi:hypothetical protein
MAPRRPRDTRTGDLFARPDEADDASARALIDQLIAQTELYATSAAFDELLAFVVRLRAFAPFNAMLLHIQKPGLTHAATAADWLARFRRKPKPDARPLLILRAMGPVDFVFDFQDTEGPELPSAAFTFPVFGDLTAARFSEMLAEARRQMFEVTFIDAGDAVAGRVELVTRAKTKTGRNVYRIAINRNHTPPIQFVTLAHELAHLFLGHLGEDRGRRVAARVGLPHAKEEVEAETVAWIVAHRNGLKPRSESYLDRYKAAFEGLDYYTIMRAANAVETVMGISAHRLWDDALKGVPT